MDCHFDWKIIKLEDSKIPADDLIPSIFESSNISIVQYFTGKMRVEFQPIFQSSNLPIFQFNKPDNRHIFSILSMIDSCNRLHFIEKIY